MTNPKPVSAEELLATPRLGKVHGPDKWADAVIERRHARALANQEKT
jgi:hypothetical protein